MTAAEVKLAYLGPGKDEVMCDFDRFESTRGIEYYILWRVDGKYLYEDTNVTDQKLPSNLANSIQDGTKVSHLDRVIFTCNVCLRHIHAKCELI